MNAQEPILNAFQAVRPRGIDAPSAAPRPHNVGRAPGLLPGSGAPLAMDISGRRIVPLKPRLNPGEANESREQYLAANDRRRAIVRGGI
ncbi:hypothetical protein [Acidovorax sp. ACV01]|jgi:hypothetical protein|uniref:hypothetical protein n=1 Tax=Acidovorax sp. ACV01 TaxID=2769311 RepID=UPI0017818DB1|nr:hypothetical protein [Acidovorax sp. ACV01]MBD9395760.1 hypothetical protein [Acidovorax sp. ACV01]